ncbi:MAG: hypothetical protein JW772_00440 [Candidatus Diapherotrites archaeon]|nr:hypothetical protein [Candidatus Diapherotrites archaeon]
MKIAIALAIALLLMLGGCVSESLAPFPKENIEETAVCEKVSIGDYPYWYECNGKKVTQNVNNSQSEISHFTIFPEQKRVFWVFQDKENTNYYSNNFYANSMTLLNTIPNPRENESIQELSAGNKDFYQILMETNRLVYKLEKRNSAEKIVSEKIYSNSLDGGRTRELTQEKNAGSELNCMAYYDNKLFWTLSTIDKNGNKTSAIYYNTLDGKGIELVSYIAKPCNPKNPSLKSSEVKTIFGCSGEAFYSKGNFVFWKYQDIWNSKNCNANSVTETIMATYIPTGRVKVLTQFARTDYGAYIETMENGIDIRGNRIVWTYYSPNTQKAALYYNCLKGTGSPRILPSSEGNVPNDIRIEGDKVIWSANGEIFEEKMLECLN